MMTYLFDKTDIKIGDIFFAKHFSWKGEEVKHYFYCMAIQKADNPSSIYEEVLGFLVSTKKQLGFSIEIELNNKPAYCCVDRQFRFKNTSEEIRPLFFVVSQHDKKNILKEYKKFSKISIKKLKEGNR